MKTLSPDLADHLTGDVTTLAYCWRLTRADGTVMGFTDHDRPIILNGVTYEATSGLTASEAVASADLSVGGGEVTGALASAAISEADIIAGLYDGAVVDVFLVNWAAPTQVAHVRSGLIGEITRRDGSFVAEVRSLSAKLDEEGGRIYQHRCDADLGDSRCGIDLTNALYQGTGAVSASAALSTLTASGLATFASGWFTRGLFTFTSGANAGFASEVKRHAIDASGVTIDLWQPAPNPMMPGDGFKIQAGCDKLIETCDQRFANAANFRGFPHIPGSDFLVAHPALVAQPKTGAALVT
jgi:uncharacterized phage protein (TIGR02218 family)